jgi:GT2 family glycosyltransferase
LIDGLIALPESDRPRASVIVLAWRNAELLGRCLRSLATYVSPAIAYETVIVCNGATTEVVALVQEHVRGARVVHSPVNLGFAGGCNTGRAAARGEFLVLLNDDAEVCEGWLESLLATADAHPQAGAVGGLIRFPDGTLQEAGCVLWSDGSTTPLGRGLPRTTRQYRYLRQVSYCSACSLLVRAQTWDAAGGMDEAYFPGYYEDVDLCLAIRALGQTVVYDPHACVLHHESASLDTRYKHFVFGRGQARFREKWASVLPVFAEPDPSSEAAIARAVFSARGCHTRVLVIDDRYPDPGAGSGFGRMYDTVAAVAGTGAAVSVFASDVAASQTTALDRLGIEVIEAEPDASQTLGPDDVLARHVADPATVYDAVIISRPNNFDRYAPLVRSAQPQASLIYDAEALYHRRLQRQLDLADDDAAADRLGAELALWQAVEHRIPVEADHVVTISADEGAVLAAVPGHAPVSVFAPVGGRGPTSPRPFTERADLLFVAGWLSGADSPNGDGLVWFAQQVLPLVRLSVPWVRLRVTGARPPAELTRLAGPSLSFTGYVEDLDTAYGTARAVISPARYGAGVKLKTVEALGHGVPVVATEVGAEGIAGPLRGAVLVTDDPHRFAAYLVGLIDDQPTWEAQHRRILAALSRATARSSEEPFWPNLINQVRQERAAASRGPATAIMGG